MKIVALLALVGFVAAYPSDKSQDEVRVKGRLVCGEYLVPQAEIKLFDKDKGSRDEEMAKTTTNTDGKFEMVGRGTDPIGLIDPYVVIFHRCQYNKMYNAAASSDNPGWKRTVVFDPENIFQYVKSAKQPGQEGKTIDLGTINLELKATKEEERWVA